MFASWRETKMRRHRYVSSRAQHLVAPRSTTIKAHSQLERTALANCISSFVLTGIVNFYPNIGYAVESPISGQAILIKYFGVDFVVRCKHGPLFPAIFGPSRIADLCATYSPSKL